MNCLITNFGETQCGGKLVADRVVVHSPPNAEGHVVTTVWAVISVDEKGNEAMVAGQDPEFGMITLHTTQERLVPMLIQRGAEVAALAPHREYKLVKFKTRVVLGVIGPQGL